MLLTRGGWICGYECFGDTLYYSLMLPLFVCLNRRCSISEDPAGSQMRRERAIRKRIESNSRPASYNMAISYTQRIPLGNIPVRAKWIIVLRLFPTAVRSVNAHRGGMLSKLLRVFSHSFLYFLLYLYIFC
jgi:hypothetical protein